MKSILPLLLPFLFAGCVSATVEEPGACKANTLTFAVVPVPAHVDAGIENNATVSASTQIDLSAFATKLSKLGTASFSIVENTLTTNQGNFDWMQRLTVYISGVQDHVDYPTVKLADQDVVNSGATLSIQSLISGDTLYSYLSQGPVELAFVVTGSLPGNVTGVDATQNLCVDAKVNINKGL